MREGIERRGPARPRAGRAATGGLALALGLAGCGDLAPVAPHEMITDPAKLYASLTLDHGAVNLATAAPYDTLRLTATPRNALGEPIDGLPAPGFRSSDTTRVRVTPDGLLQARRSANGVAVIAELTADPGITHADTVFVNVTANATPPTLTAFSIDPGASAGPAWATLTSPSVEAWLLLWTLGVLPLPGIIVNALDGVGNPIPGLAIDYESLDPTVAVIDRRSGEAAVGLGFIRVPGLLRPGQVAVVARTTAYGVTLADTAVFTVTLPVVQQIAVRSDSTRAPWLLQDEVTVVQNGYVAWMNNTSVPVEVTFEDPTNVAEAGAVCAILGEAFCGGGGIAPFEGAPIFESPEIVRYRQFPVPGVYPFRVRGDGIDLAGRVVVTNE